MSLTTMTGIALILSTLIYHGGLAYLFARVQFGEVLNLPRREKLLIIARHPDEYRSTQMNELRYVRKSSVYRIPDR
jgi:hypothetical protein